MCYLPKFFCLYRRFYPKSGKRELKFEVTVAYFTLMRVSAVK